MLLVGIAKAMLLGPNTLFITHQTAGISEMIFTVTFKVFCKLFKPGNEEQNSMHLHSSEN